MASYFLNPVQDENAVRTKGGAVEGTAARVRLEQRKVHRKPLNDLSSLKPSIPAKQKAAQPKPKPIVVEEPPKNLHENIEAEYMHCRGTDEAAGLKEKRRIAVKKEVEEVLSCLTADLIPWPSYYEIQLDAESPRFEFEAVPHLQFDEFCEQSTFPSEFPDYDENGSFFDDFEFRLKEYDQVESQAEEEQLAGCC